jgi:putative DNA primase/helicase
LVDKDELQKFLGEAAEKMGVNQFEARSYQFREQLLKQFLAIASLPKPEQRKDKVYINLKNGTFEISPEKQFLRNPDFRDFITYQLTFEYNENATAPMFQEYLNRVLPDVTKQKILAEYLGYVFIKNGSLKLEKVLLLYGTGGNGKSVFFDTAMALLGFENVCCYSLQNLTDNNGYYRAQLANKLLNYASEINGKMSTDLFKQLASGEPINARSPYGQPFTMYDYAKLLFNCNELPKEVEKTLAFFRRFLIVPFDVTIPDSEQNKQFASLLIRNELSGVFNWVLEGLTRLLQQKNFTYSEAVQSKVEDYQKQSDNVRLFIAEENYRPSTTKIVPLKDVYKKYCTFCDDYRYISCAYNNFGERLKSIGFQVTRRNTGVVVYMEHGQQ